MKKEDFLLLLNHSQIELDPEHELDVLSYIEKYPYCSTLQLANILIKKAVGSNWKDSIAKTAVYIFDRSYFKFLLSKDILLVNKEITNANSTTHDLTTEDITTFGIPKSDSDIDIFSEINAYEEITFKTASKKELIEKFLEIQSPRIKRPLNAPQESNIQEVKDVDKTNEIRNFASETLATLYEKNGDIEKSIKIYEQLCLKYPEKSATFASQIKKLRKLIQ